MVGNNIGAIPATLRRANERTLLGALMRLGRASRATLAKTAGLSQPTIGKITRELLELGMLRELDEAEGAGEQVENSRVGRPGRLLEIDREQKRFLAIELDVAETRLAAIPIAVTEDAWAVSFATPTEPRAWQKRLQQALEKQPSSGWWGILVSVPGIVDERTGRVLFSPNLHWSEKTSLPELIQGVLKLPVLLTQEIRALALGHLASHPEAQDFLLVDFGHGVGGAIVKGGKLYQNPLPLCGELGHTPVTGNRRPCGCGATGCVETLLSRSGLLKSFAESAPLSPPTWPELVRAINQYGLAPWLTASLDAGASVIAGALNVLGLRQVVMTGHLSELPPVAVDYLRAGVCKAAMWARFGEIICESAPRQRAAGLAVAGMDRLLVPVSHHEGLRSQVLA